jgi:PAS domain S-box-containing protein
MLSVPSNLARSALDAAPDAMIIIDAFGSIQFANRQISALFGYAHDEVIGQSVEKLMPERFRTRHIAHREHYVSNVRVRPMGAGLDLFGRRRDGTEFPLEISLSPIEDVGRTLVAAAIRDVTERKRAEIELIVTRKAAEAARELAEQARESADRANQGKSRFLATASHDLRQPLQTLSLLNGTLRRIVTDADAIDALSQQEQAIGAMSRLLNALLDISKLESGAIKPEPTDFTVAAIFEELRTEFATIAASKGLRLEIEKCRDQVHSDPLLVEQILRNLVSNAIKYTREGCVRLRCLHEAALIRIEVLDTGVGIAADHLPYICEEFYQIGVPTNSSRDGYGLGLSIVQRLVKLLTLKLDVCSEVGRGSTFSLILPAASGHAVPGNQESTGSPIQGPQIGKARVLVVEDDAAVRGATRMLLKAEGYRVMAVASLAQALQHLREGNGVDLLVTDYHLGDDETGTQVIATLREALGVSLRAVLMTGDTSSAVNDLRRDPFLRIASKPIDAEQLLTLLRALLAA